MLESLFNDVASLQACNLIKKRLQYRCFLTNIPKLLRIPILKNICEWLLLWVYFVWILLPFILHVFWPYWFLALTSKILKKIEFFNKSITRFFYKQSLFQLSLSVAYRYMTVWHFLNLVYLCLCLRQGTFKSYECDPFFIIISIFIIINHIFSLKQTRMFFSSFYFLPVKTSASGCCLAFA